jgi:hypothetical protein
LVGKKKENSGRFQPGNTLGRLKSQPEIRLAKTATKTEFTFMAEGIAAKPEDEMRKQCTREDKTMLENLVWSAYMKEDTKFLAWVVEMAIGKASTLSEPEEKISNIEALLKTLAKNKDPFKPKAEDE